MRRYSLDLAGFAAYVANARKDRSMTQDEFSAVSGIPQSVLSRLERADRDDIPLSLVGDLATALRVDVMDLIRAAFRGKVGV